jgi:hypothetical protein
VKAIEFDRAGKTCPKKWQSMKKQSVVENLKWLEKILSMGNARERKDVLQMWDTRFSGWIPDFKLLVRIPYWILLKNSNNFEALRIIKEVGYLYMITFTTQLNRNI